MSKAETAEAMIKLAPSTLVNDAILFEDMKNVSSYKNYKSIFRDCLEDIERTAATLGNGSTAISVCGICTEVLNML